ncbi:tetratricopeptide repeat protein [uncultured Olleya sp.]|uniref:tetratricopeptide repeat protein n=1 Tax=uncultured Olleya sp. TaxID=757243 RepID=UPI0025951CA2|nr:tetratricopeptide repeat protein [uncultured Olleya sp.]
MKVFIQVLIFFVSTLMFSQNIETLDTLIVKGIKARDNKDYTLSLEILTKVRTVAEDNKWHKQQFLALNNIGANYYSMLDYGEALDNYLEAYTLALKFLDESEEMIVLNNIAILYSKEGDLIKAEEYFYKAYTLALNHEDDIKIGLYALNLGIVANELDKLDLAINYLEDSKIRLKNHTEITVLSDVALAENKYKQNDLNEAKKLALMLLPNLESSALTEEKISTLLLLSNISKRNGKVTDAISYAKQALKVAENPEFKIKVYNQLADVYFAQGLVDKALISKDSVIALTKALSKIQNGRFYQANKVKFEVANYRKELQQNKLQQASERTRFYALLSVCALVILLISWALRNSFIKNRQRLVLHKKTKEIIELEQEKYKTEIEIRNQKLAAKALQISSRNKLLKDIIASLSNQTEVSKNVFLLKKIKELNSLLNNEKEWNSFLKHFEEVNHNFIHQLKKRHPELTANDIRYISYLYMDLTNKEISSLFNITAVASRKRKERISIKMGLSDSSSLYSYLSSV